jgi:ABC-2 type transport system permease protein
MRRAIFRWSVRRELWEHRSVFVGPLAVAAIVLLAFFYHVGRVAVIPAADPGKRAHIAALPYSAAASAILFTSLVVAFFYCLDSLNAERRDRSILFWKSMPVSDLTTVLAKFTVPFVAIPLVAAAVALASQVVMMVTVSIVLAAKGMDPGYPWEIFPLPRMTVVMLYGLFVHALWYAPIYGWLMLVSAWARRAPLLWAVLPFIAIMAVEAITMGSSTFASAIRYRLAGAVKEAFSVDALKAPVMELSQLEPARFFSNSNLWLGIAFALACVAAAVYLRRSREPN